jgi:hypothetical protein
VPDGLRGRLVTRHQADPIIARRQLGRQHRPDTPLRRSGDLHPLRPELDRRLAGLFQALTEDEQLTGLVVDDDALNQRRFRRVGRLRQHVAATHRQTQGGDKAEYGKIRHGPLPQRGSR